MKLKNIIILLLAALLIMGCQQTSQENQAPIQEGKKINGAADQDIARNLEEDIFNAMKLTINGQEFEITVYQNETVQNLMDKFPLTLQMDDLNGNEKYHDLNFNLPTKSESVHYIQAGDLMLFGSNCLVLFYDSFATSYSYTKIGHVTNADELANVVGNGRIEIKFEVNK